MHGPKAPVVVVVLALRCQGMVSRGKTVTQPFQLEKQAVIAKMEKRGRLEERMFIHIM